MKTEAQYLEPVGFKGTPGKWSAKEDIDSFTKGFVVSSDGYPVANTMYFSTDRDSTERHLKEDGHNAQLLSYSKELAKALQDMIKRLEFHIGVTNLFLGDTIALENAKQVLKEAGLTDK